MTTPQAPAGSLEQRLADLEAGYRALMTGNWTERASVVDAQGRAVRLSALAFGQVVARDNSQLSLGQNTAAWVQGAPVLDVLVTGGRLRVDVAAWLIVGGLNLRMSMSYRVIGPATVDGQGVTQLGTGPTAVAPDTTRALALESKGNAISYQMAAGFPDLVEGLAPGWYRVRGEYQLVGEQQLPEDLFGYAINRRIFATPL